ncbi:uncharacterized protein LY79DRAFT_22808 [Colletotrichum navitas]|uniref:Uncharacterized protein n=1 Tax=Colletotrichum navitas TaxID=681940 RepID=A0AAD8QEJ1_9PEZI|nr:uncharacterized protein LY79DRAFT_22808 [Colletotrichum navitas]KAK1600521.1 hypothetical protein LY79DRAFT_22808 [Colletotrichum navitas]
MLLLFAEDVSVISHAAPLGTRRLFFLFVWLHLGQKSSASPTERAVLFSSPKVTLIHKASRSLGDVIVSTYKDGFVPASVGHAWMATNAGRAMVSLANLQLLCTRARGTGVELRARQDRWTGHPRAASRPRWALIRDAKPIARTGRIRLEPEYPRAFDAISKT